MGCDIHPFLEIKLNGKWVFVSQLTSHRNYELFGCLSGVRGDNIPFGFAMPDNVPKNASQLVKDAWQEGKGDWHSLTIVEYKELQDFVEEAVLEKRADYTREWLQVISVLREVAEDARVILWYDN